MFYRKVLSDLRAFPSITPSHTLLPLAINLHVSLLLSNENNGWLVVLRWHNGLVYTAGGLSTHRRSHLCWVGPGLIQISSTNTSPAFVWGIRSVISNPNKSSYLDVLKRASGKMSTRLKIGKPRCVSLVKKKLKKEKTMKDSQVVLSGSPEKCENLQGWVKREHSRTVTWCLAHLPSLNAPLGESLQTSWCCQQICAHQTH